MDEDFGDATSLIPFPELFNLQEVCFDALFAETMVYSRFAITLSGVRR